MSASLVGSEMCIRDSNNDTDTDADTANHATTSTDTNADNNDNDQNKGNTCLLYTSDAADDM
eukprot:11724879-Alexandrium_andersonii.AAC.1